MVTELTRTGIDVIGGVPWGTHFCLFYETKEDLLDILIPYFKAGLENNEFCLWIHSEINKTEEVIAAVRPAIPGVDRHLAAGDIEILPYAEWYLKDGTFDPQRVIKGWNEKLADALVRGYAGMRVKNGNVAWLTEKRWNDFIEYENELKEIITNQRVIVFCTYPLAKSSAVDVFDAGHAHDFTSVRRNGNWEILETPELKQAKSELIKANEKLEHLVHERTRELTATAEELRRQISSCEMVEAALKESEQELRKLFAAMTDVILVLDAEGRYVKIAPTNPLNLYRSSEELLGKKLHQILSKEDADKILHQIGWVLERRQTVDFEYSLSIGLRDVCFDGRISPLTKDTVFWIARDITDRKRAEEALREKEEQYRSLSEDMPAFICTFLPDGTLTYVNGALAATVGRSPDELAGLSFFSMLTPETLKIVKGRLELLSTENPIETHEQSQIAPDGVEHWQQWTNRAFFDDNGRAVRFQAIGMDITERKGAEEEKAKLQAQLLQSQKMESIGRLAGGVAHDFNNMLGVILGHTEIALEQLDQAHPLYSDLRAIQYAAERSADLTRQLLAFARKQTVSPKVLDMNKTLSGMLKMLQRLIGEDIHLAWLPGVDLWPVKIDPAQIDQILANLCVNARDAIAGVGKVTIETRNITFDDVLYADHAGFLPGEYVLLAVSDNGCGMNKETLSKLFEPFFTTKETGKGTGLGLAMAYGIVKQNKGFIDVYSEPDQGTTFKIYLPRYAGKGEVIWTEKAVEKAIRGQETILLAEDEPAMLELATMLLQMQGYTVLAARTPGEAIRLAQEHVGEIHLLITDVVMPEMDGRDLAKNLLSIYPNLKRLFMSGYTANVIAHHGVLDEGVHFLQKPFSRKDLAVKVREALDQK